MTDERILDVAWRVFAGFTYEPTDAGAITFARAILAEAPNPVERIGQEFTKAENGPDPRGVDILVEALDATLREHGFCVQPTEDE